MTEFASATSRTCAMSSFTACATCRPRGRPGAQRKGVADDRASQDAAADRGEPRRSADLRRSARAAQRLHLSARESAAEPRGSERLRSVLGRHQARRHRGNQPAERAVSQRRPADDADRCRERGVRPQADGHAASRAQPGANGRAGSSEVSRADAAVVHEPEHAQAGGAHPRHRARASRQHDRARRRVRLRARRRGDVSAARHHGDPRRAARRRGPHADADAAAVRQPGSGAEPLAPGHPRHGGNGEAAAGRSRRLLRVLPQAHRSRAVQTRATTSPR